LINLTLYKLGNKSKPKLNNAGKSDSFDVRSNLKKLNNNNRQNSQSDYQYLNVEQTRNEVVSSTNYTTGFQETTYKEFKELNNKIHSNFSSLKEDINQTRHSFNSKISSEMSDLKKDFDLKLDGKIDSKLFYGAISVLVVITGIIATLSYFPMIAEVKDFKDKNTVVNDSVKNHNIRLNKIEKSIKK